MSVHPIDELHSLITDLEGEGHVLAGRFRDILDRIKADFVHLADGGGKSKGGLDDFVKGLVGALVPEFDKVKLGVIAQVVTEVHKAAEEIKATLETNAAHHAASAEPGAPANPAPTPVPVEPTPAPAQG